METRIVRRKICKNLKSMPRRCQAITVDGGDWIRH